MFNFVSEISVDNLMDFPLSFYGFLAAKNFSAF